MLDRLKNFVLSTFAKNLPLMIKLRGGVIPGGVFFIQGKGLYVCVYTEVSLSLSLSVPLSLYIYICIHSYLGLREASTQSFIGSRRDMQGTSNPRVLCSSLWFESCQTKGGHF